ncbi:FtsX-like permease family protein [uncultured Parvibaculum sp.]|uniref:ABC transporter permease n=1 Tax=uncultured Parvibaculum sp. TaxID=291828 RepID=UPI0030EB49A6|tara:strand:- start:7458 stop:10025 length:2568 start_codon:yes stop_codon:yes gene_type:complete
MNNGSTSFVLAARLARRELRGGLKGFRVFIACLALGVAAIAGVGSVSTALTRGLAEGGQEILGGDVAIRLIHRAATAEELAFISAGNAVSAMADMRAMARGAGAHDGAVRAQTLVELKAVDNLYPLYGAMALQPDIALAEALALRDGRWGLVVEPNLMTRLGVAVGDLVRIGEAELELRAVIEREPDRVSDGFALGPRAMIAMEALEATALVQPGSLVSYHYRVRLPAAQRSPADIAGWVAGLNQRFPDAGWRVQDRSDSAPGVRRFVERVALFLSLVGLTALVVGGVGVANAVKSYLDGKRTVIATFKCLGAPGALIFRLYLMQVMALAAVGIVLGLVIGGAAPFIVDAVAGGAIPIPADLGLYGAPLVLAAAYGVLTALAFAIWPLARAREVPATSLFRDLVAPTRRFPRPAYVAATAAALLALAGMAVGLAEEPVFALYFVAGAAGVFVVLFGAARGIMALAARAPRVRSPGLRLALANIHRPGAPTTAIVLSLGLGLTLLVTVSLINGNLTGQIASELLDRAPAFFFVDVQPDQIDALEEIVSASAGVTSFNRVPMLRGRIAAVNGVPSDQLTVSSDVQWALRGDRGITYSAALPAGSTLVRGEWWPEDYAGPPLVSFGEDLALGFGVEIGDTITVNVLGREMSATIANTRAIDWSSLGINFVLVFSPGALSAAPHTVLATVAMEGGDAAEEALERDVTTRFPNITSVRVKEALEAVNGLLENFAMAVRATGAVTLAAGVLVLAGAMAAGFSARVRDAVVLKVLGATTVRILGIYVREYALLGLATALVAALAGSLAGFAVITLLMEMPWRFLPGTLALTVIGAALVTVALGLAGTWRALAAPAAPVLRAD